MRIVVENTFYSEKKKSMKWKMVLLSISLHKG